MAVSYRPAHGKSGNAPPSSRPSGGGVDRDRRAVGDVRDDDRAVWRFDFGEHAAIQAVPSPRRSKPAAATAPSSPARRAGVRAAGPGVGSGWTGGTRTASRGAVRLGREVSRADPGLDFGASAGRGVVAGWLTNGRSACAASAGVWNRFAGSLAIILATTAANSPGTAGWTRLSEVASAKRCRSITAISVPPPNGGRPLSR